MTHDLEWSRGFLYTTWLVRLITVLLFLSVAVHNLAVRGDNVSPYYATTTGFVAGSSRSVSER